MKKIPNPNYQQFATASAPREPADFSWIGFQQNDSRADGMTNEELLDSINNTQVDVDTLDLSGNGLGLSEPTFLSAIFQVLKENFTRVNLSHNALNLMEISHLIAALSRIPSSVLTLDLNNNKLGKLSFEQFKQVINALPMNTLERVNVFNNGLQNYPEMQINAFIDTFHGKIKTIDSDYEARPAPRLP